MYTIIVAKLARVLAAWRECTNSSVARRIGRERAVVHSNRHLLWNCLTAWHHYHQLALRKMVCMCVASVYTNGELVVHFVCSCFRGKVRILKGVVYFQCSMQNGGWRYI